jgi:hypothetical protein
MPRWFVLLESGTDRLERRDKFSPKGRKLSRKVGAGEKGVDVAGNSAEAGKVGGGELGGALDQP